LCPVPLTVRGRLEKYEAALRTLQEVFDDSEALYGISNSVTLTTAVSVATVHSNLRQYAEMLAFVRKHDLFSACNRALGANHELSLRIRYLNAFGLFWARRPAMGGAEALRLFEDVNRDAQRVLGSSYPVVLQIQRDIKYAREVHESAERLFPEGLCQHEGS
jgi:hypothetical protein